MGTAALSGTALRVRAATGDGALDLLDDAWDELLLRQPRPNPTLSATWLRALARWKTGVPFVLVAEQDGRVHAGAALELRHAGRLAPVVATWLGPVEQQFSADMLGDATLLLDAIFAEADVLTLATPAAGAAASALAAAAPWRRSEITGNRWVLPCPAPRLDLARRHVARDLRHAGACGVTVETRVAVDPQEVEAGLVRLFRVHRERWRDRNDETPRFATTGAHRRWNREAFVAMAARGSARLVEVLEDGRTVAASVALVVGRGGVAHTTAMRGGGVLRHPGHLAALARYEALADAGVATIDLGVSSGEPGTPKARFGPDADPMALVFAASSPRRQRASEAMQQLRRAARGVHGG